MGDEAQTLAYRRSAEHPPQRHRDYPQIKQISQIPRHQICVNRRNLRIRCSWRTWRSLWALGVSVVKNSQKGHAEADLIVQNKANFQRGKMGARA
jgi:hypothetical protein